MLVLPILKSRSFKTIMPQVTTRTRTFASRTSHEQNECKQSKANIGHANKANVGHTSEGNNIFASEANDVFARRLTVFNF